RAAGAAGGLPAVLPAGGRAGTGGRPPPPYALARRGLPGGRSAAAPPSSSSAPPCPPAPATASGRARRRRGASTGRLVATTACPGAETIQTDRQAKRKPPAPRPTAPGHRGASVVRADNWAAVTAAWEW